MALNYEPGPSARQLRREFERRIEFAADATLWAAWLLGGPILVPFLFLCVRPAMVIVMVRLAGVTGVAAYFIVCTFLAFCSIPFFKAATALRDEQTTWTLFTQIVVGALSLTTFLSDLASAFGFWRCTDPGDQDLALSGVMIFSVVALIAGVYFCILRRGRVAVLAIRNAEREDQARSQKPADPDASLAPPISKLTLPPRPTRSGRPTSR